jgi:hypothetical protein
MYISNVLYISIKLKIRKEKEERKKSKENRQQMDRRWRNSVYTSYTPKARLKNGETRNTLNSDATNSS